MEAYENLCTRRSVRKYNNKPISKEILEKIVYAGQCAPTGMNRQPLTFVVIQNKEVINKISKLNANVMKANIDPFYGCNALIIVFANKAKSPTYMYDGNLAMGNLMNAAHAFDVSSCFIFRAKEVFEMEEGKALMKEWGLSEDYEGIGNCILGYTDDQPEMSPRTSEVKWICE